LIPIENDARGGTNGSHFERTYYYDESMTATSSAEMAYSGFTWSVL